LACGRFASGEPLGLRLNVGPEAYSSTLPTDKAVLSVSEQVFRLVRLFLVLPLLSCVSAGTQLPAWPDTGVHSSYPTARYVVGVGWGDTMDVADDRARGEVAKFFRAKVVTVTREEEHYMVSGGPQGREERLFESITHARTRGDAVFNDSVVMVERTVREGTHYTLAVLDMQAMRQRLERDLAEMETEIAERLDTKGAPALLVRSLARALYLLHQKRNLAHRLQLVGRKVPIDPETISQVSKTLHQTLAAAFPIAIESNDEELAKQLSSTLTKASLVVAPAAPDSEPIIVIAKLELSVAPADGLHRAHYQVHLQAVQREVVLAQVRDEERIAHPDSTLAAAKARIEVEQRAVRPFVKDLSNALLGDFAATADEAGDSSQ